MSQAFLKASPPIDDVVGRALLERRLPVLVSRRAARAPVGAAVIAWDGSPPAGRAVRAALPLLAMASQVTILQCRAGLDTVAADADPRRLKDYLAVAGIDAGVSVIKGRREGEAILAAACTRSADLLVAGAYSRPRLAEAVLGGA
ncbi:MAG: universal stress protein, partial [Brevundimonas sp.]